MRRLFTLLVLVLLVGFYGCNGDCCSEALKEQVDSMEGRLEELKKYCEQMNSNVASLQAVVNALQRGDFVTGVTPLTVGDSVTGYIITFANGDPITIYNGRNGADGLDGTTPVVAVRGDGDALYWTVNGEWLLDGGGARIPASPTNGITPRLKIEGSEWYVSYDDGMTWSSLGEVSDSTIPALSSPITEVTHDTDYSYFELFDGSVITLPKAMELTVNLSTDKVVMLPNSTFEVGYSLTGGSHSVVVEVIASGMVGADLISNDERGGVIKISAGSMIGSFCKVVLIITDGTKVVLRTIDVSEGKPDDSGTSEPDSLYTSTDYSDDGQVILLQRATVGNGIDIVFMGDGYSDRQIAGGDYESDIDRAVRYFFSVEPYASLRDHFNLYCVKVVSPNEGYDEGGTTALEGYFGEGTRVGGNHSKVLKYALKAVGESRMDEATIVVMMNRRYYAGTCYMYAAPALNYYGSGTSIAFFGLGTNNVMLSQLIHHEAGGHGFAKLADEYAHESNGTIPATEMLAKRAQQAASGWWKNIDFTADSTQIRWSEMLYDSRYAEEGVGIFEGGLTYWKGVWRPFENSIMLSNSGGFNAPSREAIYSRVMFLTHGSEWQYDYEEFVKWDMGLSVSNEVFSLEHYPQTTPPVVYPYSWKMAL